MRGTESDESSPLERELSEKGALGVRPEERVERWKEVSSSSSSSNSSSGFTGDISELRGRVE
jgi:hypothetical protein